MRVPATAPMLGKILRITAKPGDQVQEDDTLMVMEAMKMEIEVVSPTAGTVAEIKVAPGDSVDADDEVAFIESE